MCNQTDYSKFNSGARLVQVLGLDYNEQRNWRLRLPKMQPWLHFDTTTTKEFIGSMGQTRLRVLH